MGRRETKESAGGGIDAAADDDWGAPQRLRASRLDRESRLFLKAIGSFVGRPVGREQVDAARRRWRLIATAYGRRPPVASITTRHVNGPAGPIELRLYTPAGGPARKPGFLWCHGGGFIVGDLDANDAICRSIARESGAVVVAVRYRLAPEHDLYASREDFLAALAWVAQHGESVGIDTGRMAIGGDSAGGNISAAVAQENLRRGGPALRLQVLVYPSTRLFAPWPSLGENASGHFLTTEFIQSLQPLIAKDVDLADPLLSPGLARDLRGLPPALVITAGFDPIRDDGLAYCRQLRAAGVPVELLHYGGQFHGFLNFDSVIGAARDALSRIGRSLAGAFDGAAGADRTLEIEDEAPTLLPVSRHLARDALVGGFLASRSARQFGSAAARWMAPGLATATATMLRPWWVPVAMVRRATLSRLCAVAARQTFARPPTTTLEIR
ncbi:MAG: alpha/beta hydrolase [Burkholderiaceae bacterium]